MWRLQPPTPVAQCSAGTSCNPGRGRPATNGSRRQSNAYAEGRIHIRIRPLALVAGAGFEPATSGVMSYTACVFPVPDAPSHLADLRIVLVSVAEITLRLPVPASPVSNPVHLSSDSRASPCGQQPWPAYPSASPSGACRSSIVGGRPYRGGSSTPSRKCHRTARQIA
jgi:hypothetical protein